MTEATTPELTTMTTAPDAAATPAVETVAEVAAADPLDTPSLINADTGDKPADDVKADAPVEGEAVEEPVVEGPPDAYDLVAPEGFTLDPEAVKLFDPVARELGLSNEGANKLMPVAAAFAQQVADKASRDLIDAVVAQRTEWAKATLADPVLGGTAENQAAVRQVYAKAIDDLGSPELRTLLDETGLGNNPVMLRFIHKAGLSIAEESRMFRADAGATAPKRPEQVMYAPEFQPKG